MRNFAPAFATLALLAFCVVMGLDGCNGCNSNTGGSSGNNTDCSGSQSVFMSLNIGTIGNQVVYGGTLPGNATCVNRVTGIQNTVGSALRIANGSNGCDSGSPITLQDNSQPAKAASATQMMQLFGTLNPKLPIALSACGNFANPPQQVTLAVTLVASVN